MNKKFGERMFVNNLVIVTSFLSIVLLIATVPVMATMTNEGTTQLTTDGASIAISWSPDSSKILYVGVLDPKEDFGLWVLNADGSDKRQLDSTGSKDLDIFGGYMGSLWSPDGNKIIYTVYDKEHTVSMANNEIWVINTDGTGKTLLASDAAFPSWSPDGTKIAYMTVDKEFNYDIWVMNSDDSDKTLIASDAAFPSWSPDGTKIIYIVDLESDASSISLKDLNDGRTTSLVSNAVRGIWSPDGNKISYTTRGGGLYILDVNGGGQTLLGNGKNWMISPQQWNPDGTKIAYMANQHGEMGIVVADADGTNKTKLTSNYVDFAQPIWSPDGTKIAYTVFDEKSIYIRVMSLGESYSVNETIDGFTSLIFAMAFGIVILLMRIKKEI